MDKCPDCNSKNVSDFGESISFGTDGKLYHGMICDDCDCDCYYGNVYKYEKSEIYTKSGEE